MAKLRYSQIALGLTLSVQVACSAPSNHGEDAHLRGNEEFKSFLRLGAGSLRPAVSEPLRGIGLNADSEGVVQIMMDPASETWSWVTFNTNLSPSVAEESALENFARNYIEAHDEQLGLLPEELLTFDNSFYQPLSNTHMVTFNRIYEGRPVKGAFVQLIFNKMPEGDLRLREILNNSYGRIALSGDPTAPNPQVAIAATGIEGLELNSSRDWVVPQLNASGTYDFRFATEFALKDQEFGELFYLTLDNSSTDILEASSDRSYAKHELAVSVYERSYVFNDAKPRPFAFVDVRDAANALVTTDIKGTVESNATTASIVLATATSHSGIVDRTVANTTAFYSFPVTLPAAGGKTTISMTQADPAALNVYVAVHEVAEYIKPFLTGVNVPLLTNGIQANVNLADPQNLFCNAFYDGTSINFLRQGGGCANTGLINDVVYHEWGHALDDDLGVVVAPRGITDGAFSEGIGDIIGMLLTNSPEVGPGIALNNAKSVVRNLVNTSKHPPASAAEAQVHEAGKIIGGSFWDLRKNLIALHGQTEGHRKVSDLMLKHLTMTDRYIDSYQSVLRLDDDDQNPATRSPNYCSINKAFAAHGLTGDVIEGDSCIDVDPGIKVRVDVDLGEGKLSLFASSYAAESLIACPGKVTRCAASDPGAVSFQKDGATANSLNGTALNSKLFYQGMGTLQTKPGADVFTFLSFDKDGKTIGFKTLQFKSRNQNSDLSQSLR